MRQIKSLEVPLVFPADSLVAEAALGLPDNASILDVGAGWANNSFYLADQGHDVFAVEHNPLQLLGSQKLKQVNEGLNINLIQGDMRKLMFDGVFDAVIATRCLQEVSPNESYDVVKDLQALVKPGGQLIIRAYIASHNQKKQMPLLNLFLPGELPAMFDSAEWTFTKNLPELLPLVHLSSGVPECQSTVQIIASKTPLAVVWWIQ